MPTAATGPPFNPSPATISSCSRSSCSQKAGTFIYLIFGLVLLFPLSTDPLRKIPPSRLALWPLERRELWFLRLASPWINPLTWGIAALAIWGAGRTITVGLVAIIAGLFAAVFLISALPIPRGLGLWRRVPQFPGPLNQLVRKNLREILSTLDFYCALILSATALLSRFLVSNLPREAMLAMTVLVVARHVQLRPVPLRSRWRRRTLPLPPAPRPRLAVAARQRRRLPRRRDPVDPAACAACRDSAPPWSLSRSATRPPSNTLANRPAGASAPAEPSATVCVQMVALAMTASGIFSTSLWFLPLAAAVWGASLWWYGRELERQL